MGNAQLQTVDNFLSASRWIVLACFLLLSLSNNSTQYTFAPIVTVVKDFYHIGSLLLTFLESDTLINLLAIVYMISGFTVRFLGMYVIDHRGLGLAVFMAMLVNLAGGWLRFFGGLPTSCPNSSIPVKDCPNPTSDRKTPNAI